MEKEQKEIEAKRAKIKNAIDSFAYLIIVICILLVVRANF